MKEYLKYIETDIVHHCNLRCAGCTHFSPLYEPNWFKSVTDFENEMQRLAELFELQNLRIMGGEPLLHEQFMEFLRIARKYFPNTKIALATNGILLNRLIPHIEEFNNSNFFLSISDYRILGRSSLEILSHIKLLEAYDKAYMYNLSLDLTCSQDPKLGMTYCDHIRDGCVYLRDGRIFKCAVLGNIEQFNCYFKTGLDYKLENYSIDIFNYTATEILEYLKNSAGCELCDVKTRYNSWAPFKQSEYNINEWIRH